MTDTNPVFTDSFRVKNLLGTFPQVSNCQIDQLYLSNCAENANKQFKSSSNLPQNNVLAGVLSKFRAKREENFRFLAMKIDFFDQ